MVPAVEMFDSAQTHTGLEPTAVNWERINQPGKKFQIKPRRNGLPPVVVYIVAVFHRERPIFFSLAGFGVVRYHVIHSVTYFLDLWGG